MRVLICGGRYFNDPLDKEVVFEALHELKPSVVICDSDGAGAFAQLWADTWRIPRIPFKDLEQDRPDVVLAFPWGRWRITRRAKALGIKVVKVR